MSVCNITAMQVWVTRPQAAGKAWVQGLRQAGFDAYSLPLLALAPVPDTSPIANAWLHLQDYAAAMFVSPAAVDYFFQMRRTDALPAIRWWAPGEGTRQALLHQGVAAAQVDSPDSRDGRFDSQALWAQVQHQVCAQQKYLLLRGTAADGSLQGREDLTMLLGQRSAQVDTVEVYRRQPTPPQTPVRSGVWLFSASLSLQALPKAPWEEAVALCTHERIAATARDWGFTQIVVTQPRLDHIVAALKQIAIAYPARP